MTTEDQSQRRRRPPAHEAAYPCRTAEQMLPHQEFVVFSILDRIYQIASKEVESGSATQAPGSHVRHPSNVFLIDGSRGSGKTTVILTLKHYVEYLGRLDDGGGDPTWQDIANPQLSDERHKRRPNWKREQSTKRRALLGRIGTRRHAAKTLPVVFPEEMESSESLMELVFSLVTDTLKTFIENHDGHSKARAIELEKKLTHEVARGWHFSQADSHDQFWADCADFPDYISRRTEEARISGQRNVSWRGFVDEYLELFDSEMLILTIDDADATPAWSMNALHALRVFLDHPRIICIVGGNLEAIRTNILLEQFRKHKLGLDALGDVGRAAIRLRNSLRLETEEFLFKVLPQSFRYQVRSDEADLRTLLSNDDGKKESSFVRYCQRQMATLLKAFVAVKSQAGLRSLPQATTGPSEGGEDLKRKLGAFEDYIAWWLVRTFYSSALVPRTARQVATLGDLVDLEGTRDETLPRVADVFFRLPENYHLIQRFDDRGIEFLRWVRQQDLSSSWRDERKITVNTTELYESDYGYNYLLYCMDLAIALPLTQNSTWPVPSVLLPKLAGRPLWLREIWEDPWRRRETADLPADHNDSPSYIDEHIRRALNDSGLRPYRPEQPGKDIRRFRREQRLFGVAAALQSPVVPSNCIYFKDLRSLPDIAWAYDTDVQQEPSHSADTSSHLRQISQEESLHSVSRRPIGSDVAVKERLRFSALDFRSSFSVDEADRRTAYFRDVVCQMACYPRQHPPIDAYQSDHHQDLFTLETRRHSHLADMIDQAMNDSARRPAAEAALGGIFRVVLPASNDGSATDEGLSSVRDEVISRLAPERPNFHYGFRRALARILERESGHLPHLQSILSPQLLADEVLASSDSLAKYVESNNGAPLRQMMVRGFERTIEKVVPQYYRIRQDMRRAWHAIRICRNDRLHFPREEASIEDDQQLGRSDLYTLVGIGKIEETINELLAHATGSSAPAGASDSSAVREAAQGRFAPPVPESMAEWRHCMLRAFDGSVHCIRFTEDESEEEENLKVFRELLDVLGNESGGDTPEAHEEACESVEELRRVDSPECWPTARSRFKKFKAPHGSSQLGDEGSTAVSERQLLLRLDRAFEPARDGKSNFKELEHFLEFFLDTRNASAQGDSEAGRRRARTFRSLFLLLWGLGPCLSALIHVQLISRLYMLRESIRRTNQRAHSESGVETQPSAELRREAGRYLRETAARLRRWREFLEFGQLFASTVGHHNEHFHAEISPELETENTMDVYAPMPDIAISTMGLRYVDRAGRDEMRESPQSSRDDEKLAFRGITGDILTRYVVAEAYLDQLQEQLPKVYRDLFRESNSEQSD